MVSRVVELPQAKRARAEERTCRLCYGGEDDGPLVQPCACRGTAKWVHKNCLEEWRRTGEREDAAYRCGQCMDHYRDALSLELLSDRLESERASGKDIAFTLNKLAIELHDQGKYDEAELLYREALEAYRELGDRHPGTLASINNLGGLLQDKGDLAAAEPLLREAVEGQRATRVATGIQARSPASATSACCWGARATTLSPNRCFARRWRRSARPWATGIQARSHPSATSPPPNRCCERRWRGSARPSAIGIRARSPPSTTSARC